MFSNCFTGGLEYDAGAEVHSVTIGGIEYVLSDRFKSMLRDTFLDWEAFIEVHKQNATLDDMFDTITRVLNIKDQDPTIKDSYLELVQTIYYLPLSAHLASMLKQFMIHEPVSAAIQAIFTTIKHHFEHVVEKYISLRNAYIVDSNAKYKTNNWDKLYTKWEELNDTENLDSSSIVLYFLNNKKHGPKLDLDITESEALVRAVSEFSYKGFCPKVPDQRLKALLSFPLSEFITAIKALIEKLQIPDQKIPNYEDIEQKIAACMERLLPKPETPNDPPREPLPADLEYDKSDIKSIDETKKVRIIQWYVTQILQMRKSLIPIGSSYEKYYIQNAEILCEINEILEHRLR